jgi:hypothetical protein
VRARARVRFGSERTPRRVPEWTAGFYVANEDTTQCRGVRACVRGACEVTEFRGDGEARDGS